MTCFRGETLTIRQISDTRFLAHRVLDTLERHVKSEVPQSPVNDAFHVLDAVVRVETSDHPRLKEAHHVTLRTKSHAHNASGGHSTRGNGHK